MEIIREIESDPALRASLRAVLLGDEILELPTLVAANTSAIAELKGAVAKLIEAQERTDATVGRLAEAQERTDATVGRLATAVGKLEENLGEIVEVSCAAVLGAVAEMKGWTAIDAPGPIDVGEGEVDVRGRFSTTEGEVVVLAEAKSRLRGGDVKKWARRVTDETWRARHLYEGFGGTVLAYVYGTLVYADAYAEARRVGIGVIGPEGEREAAVAL